ncbi:hypothetical protein Q4E93_08600 [Flavitalea sp. BT771]|uniref:hypothetical protein n=1 Tax=Flavitalea sp. BT771 TaxID=3063329 RepID=UPI0026E3011C|nr:hypothetical protein [Flavitalea sp. BT771]MDO6430644.1 hypothetical protein [Flavitalea sp. BT771]MDV6219216.1 hypothetical protein [Flavitalea sp. BT771]
MKIKVPLAVLVLLVCGGAATAQSPVTQFSGSYSSVASSLGSYTAFPSGIGTFSGCSSTLYTYTFSNGSSNQYKLYSFNANGSTYFVAPGAAAAVKLRRVNNARVTGTRNIVYMESTASSATACPSPGVLNFKPPYVDVMENVLTAGILNEGTDNLFTNASNGDDNNNNIERVDVIFSSGLNTAYPEKAGFTILDRGANYNHDPFRIAAITSLDASGNPASFGAVRICTGGNGSTNGSWGHPTTANGNKQFAAYVLRKDASDAHLRVSSVVNQEIGGVFFSFADLGITAGQTLYGYALLGPDGITSPTSAQLLNLTDATVYPTNTTESAGGGLDLVAVNTVFATGSFVVLALSVDDFTGAIQDNKGLLQWRLGNADEFFQLVVQRGADGTNFYDLPAVSPGIRSADNTLEGSYTDVTLTGAGVYYYRLKMVLSGQQVRYSRVLALRGEDPASTAGWRIFPTQPGQGQSLKLQGLRDGNYTLYFYSAGGACRNMPVQVNGGQASVQPPSVPGVYWVRLSAGDKYVAGNAKILVE